MALSLRACVSRAASHVIRPLLAAAGVMALAGCGPDGQPGPNAAQPRGASVAFESIDGPPPAQFRKLVDNLNEEAQARRLAVASRESPSAFRVRGYLAAKTAKGETTVSWVWDVFDGDQHRALRITGEESVKGRHRDAWTVADDAMLQRIARSSMDQLADLPDLTRRFAEHPSAPVPRPRPDRLDRRSRPLAGSRRHFPHLQAASRSRAGDGGRRLDDICREDRLGAAAARPADRGQGGRAGDVGPRISRRWRPPATDESLRSPC